MSLNIFESQQRPPAHSSTYSNRNSPFRDCKAGNRPLPVVTAQQARHMSEPIWARETPARDKGMPEWSQVNNKLPGVYLPAFIGGTRVMWFIDTGAPCSTLSLKFSNSLPASVKFSLSTAN